jgi:hypothetical protein
MTSFYYNGIPISSSGTAEKAALARQLAASFGAALLASVVSYNARMTGKRRARNFERMLERLLQQRWEKVMFKNGSLSASTPIRRWTSSRNRCQPGEGAAPGEA